MQNFGSMKTPSVVLNNGSKNKNNKSEYFSVQLENVLLKFPPKKLSIQKIRLERKKIIANVPFDIGGGYP